MIYPVLDTKVCGCKLAINIKLSPDNFSVLTGSIFKMIHISSLRGGKGVHKVTTTNEMRYMASETTYDIKVYA